MFVDLFLFSYQHSLYIEKIRNDVTEIKEYEKPKLNAIQEEVNKRIQEKTGKVKDDISFDIDFATEKFNQLDLSMFKVISYLDEIGEKVTNVVKLLKEE